ncbi:snRNA-activating protein complex subunit 1 isoform X2 [Lingula anatina]|nr:snRNA-activating protein complex subunit 1 isoform X2 [Lingula anatina]XP_013378809.1 snRNA-activating protein complex subunit 1 isoform X2 [Lingula anatina]|eukprot:XP_013378808.1 snRNA-activating protein complex subunit 1 isoform X2 [Lingula anatina]
MVKERVYTPLAGVLVDMQSFVEEFTATESVRYEQFAEIWREKKMSLIFCGRQTERELKEFTEDMFSVVLQYLGSSQTFQVQVAGLFLLYGLYHTQPLKPKAKVRVTREQFQSILQFHREVKNQGHLDVDYVFQKLKIQRAFDFVANAHPCDILQATHTADDDLNKDSLPVEKSVVSEILQPDNIAQLATIHEQYVEMKCRLAGRDRPDTALDVIQPDIVQYLTRAVASHEEWRKTGKRLQKKDGGITSESEAESDVEHPKPSVCHGRKRASIRERAFSKTAEPSRGRRHRRATVHNGTEQSPTKSPPKKRGRKSSRVESMEEQEVLRVPTVNLREEMRSVILNMPRLSGEEKVSKRGKKSKTESMKNTRKKEIKKAPKEKGQLKEKIAPKGKSKVKLSKSKQCTPEENIPDPH